MTDRATTCELAANLQRGMVKADHPMLAGHFPDHPIVPGAWLLAWIVATATRQLSVGELRSVAAIKRVKFLRPLAPDQPFECTLTLRASSDAAHPADKETMRFTVTSNGSVIAEGSLLLQSRATNSAR
jgi:3-hydroxymyristoyl/3-hydroxydecanoyl-(acyl carrier protein) dehydratase